MAGRDELPPGWRRNVTLRLAQDGLTRLRAEGARRDSTVSEVIRMCIANALPALERERVKAPIPEEIA